MRYLWLALIIGLLSGCGGGGLSNGAALRAKNIPSTLSLTGARAGVPFETLTVHTSVKTTPVTASGEAEVAIYNEGPQHTRVVDPQGRTVLMGFVSPTNPNLNPSSTAQAMAYMALGGIFMKEAGRVTVLEYIHTLAGYDAFEDAVEAQITRDGFLDPEDATIQSTLATMVNHLMTTKARGVIATPTSATGLSVDTTVDDKLTFTNVYLRRVSLFMRRTGHRIGNTDVDEPNTPWQKLEMPAVARYGGITGTIDGFLKGEVAYTPVTSEPFDIPLSPNNAKRTYYQVNAVGPGSDPGTLFDDLPEAQKDELRVLELKTIFLDAFLVLIANAVIPVKGDQVDDFLKFIGSNSAVSDIINNLRTTVPQVYDLVVQGEYWQATKAILTSGYTSNTIMPLMGQLTIDYLESHSDLSQAELDDITSGMKDLLGTLGKIDVGFTLADSALLFHDIAVSTQAQKFEFTVTPGKVTVSAARTTISPTGTTLLTATVQDKDPNGVYEYQWTVSPNSNYWIENSHLVGTDDSPNGILVTNEEPVNIRSFVTTAGEAVATCTVFRLDGGRREVGTDDITITFDPQQVNIQTTHPVIQVTKQVVHLLDGGYSGHYCFWYLIPINEHAYYMRITGTWDQVGGSYFRQWNEPRANPNIYIASPYSELVIAPPANHYKVYVKNGWDGVVGGFSTEAAAQANLDSMVQGQLNYYNAHMTTTIEQYLTQ